MKPFVGQVIQYRYKPESSAEPLAAIVTVVHAPSAVDGKEWVALHVFSEVPRTLPYVEFATHCSMPPHHIPSVAEPTVKDPESWPPSPWSVLP